MTFAGVFDRVQHAGINPPPIQRPIPIWFGGTDDRALRRLARLGDGWFPQSGPDEKGRAAVEKVRGYIRGAGRNPQIFGIEGRMSYGDGNPESWLETLRGWKNLSATHVGLNTMKAGLSSPPDHIEALRRFHGATSSEW